MPPAAALECERTGWTLDMMATVAPASAAARAARWPASPAPMIRTSCAGVVRDLIHATRSKPPRSALCDRAHSEAPGGKGSCILPLPMGSVRALIVDDHADVRFLIRTIVADAGLPVEV